MDVILKNISKFYNNTKVLDNISLNIYERNFTVILGPSGSGKTTLLNIIAGLENQSSGGIFFGNKDITQANSKDRDLGFVFQNYVLYPHLTIKQNITFPLRFKTTKELKALNQDKDIEYKNLNNKQLRKKLIEDSVQEISKKLAIDNLLHKKSHQLSGGEKQRVAIGRALIKRPKSNLLLFDEPLSNLDPQLRAVLREEIKRIHHEFKMTVLYVTHDQYEAMSIADRIIIINDSKIQQIDTPKNIYDFPSNLFVAKFIGNIPMNIFSPSDEIINKFANYNQIKEKLKEIKVSEVLFGIRSENIAISEDNSTGLRGTITKKEFQGVFTIFKVLLDNNLEIYVSVYDAKLQKLNNGSHIYVSFKEGGLHVFDKKTGKLI